MRHVMILILLAGLLCMCTTMPSCSTERADAGELADVSLELSDGTLVDLIVPPDGATQKRDGVSINRRYAVIPQSRGPQTFTIRIQPKTVPIGAVVAVDGHNVLSGERIECFTTKQHAGRAFVLPTRAIYCIEGWRETSTAVRRFRLTDQHKSLSWQLSGDLSDAGTIAVSVFMPRKSADVPLPEKYFGRLGTDAGERIYRPINVVPFDSEPTASEVFAARLIRPTEAALLKRQWAFDSDQGFIGPLP